MGYTNFDQILEDAARLKRNKVAVACAHEQSVMEALRLAQNASLAQPLFIGDAERIYAIAHDLEYAITPDMVLDEPDDIAAARRAVQMVREGECDVLMKGQIHTADLLRAILDREAGLRTGRIMSHVFILELKDRLLMVTDGAMNIKPDLMQKAQIICNAVFVAQGLGIRRPKVAVLAAVETVNPDVPSTIDAAILSKMAERNQIPDCIVDGPFQMDNILSEEAARMKRLNSPVAGNADIVLVPDIEAGNALVKMFAHASSGRVAGILVGASAPVVLTSRADTAESKMLSIAVAAILANPPRRARIRLGTVSV
ncbi:MAG: phosphate butyryltransferase [Armatimonadota bacterium]|nr:MAG: phosphate butyryltransferase [Armatimonadota bacterium]